VWSPRTTGRATVKVPSGNANRMLSLETMLLLLRDVERTP